MAQKKYLDLDGLTHYEASIKSRLLAESESRIAGDAGLQSRINSLASGSPLVASSTAGMTDTTRVYVNTTDGYWYYYDGDSWERGGIYQSTDISDLSIGAEKTKFAKRSENLIDIVNANILNAHPGGSNSTMSPSNNVRSLYIPCEPDTTYIVTRSVSTGRFAVCDSAVLPTTSSTYSNKQEVNTSSSVVHTTNSTAEYLIVYYWNNNYSPNTAYEALTDLCVLKGAENRGVISSYVVEVKTVNLNTSAVTPEKTSFNKDSSNLFDKNNPNVVNAHPTGGSLSPSDNVRSIYIPCEPNTNYVIKRAAGKRFAVCSTNVTPESGVAYTNLIEDFTAEQIKYATSSNANYLFVYLWNTYQDTMTPEQIMATLVIVKGSQDVNEYIPYGKIIEVKTDNINDKAVTPAKLSDDLRESLSFSGSLASRNGIYGVEYDLTSSSSACTRIGNAVGLKNDYIIEDTFALNGGQNDFDNIFPWSDIRRCNVKVSAPNGQKTITYEGEQGFTLDGSNGDVMVEIPKFYSYRERVGNKERIAISGERKSGFVCEPAFVVDGKELEHIYVACYHQAETPYMGSHSYSGSFPIGNKTIAENIAELGNGHVQSYDFSTYLMLQKLMIIEFADRGIQQYLGGMTRLPYWTSSTNNVIDGFGTNYITFQANVGQGTLSSFWVGERIRVGGTIENDLSRARIITDISQVGTQITVTYDGDSYTDLSIGDGVGCYAQQNGLCDSLTYHTGRTDFVPDSSIANYVNPMRYRYIENVIGNIWEQVAGLRVKGLQPYYSFEPNVNQAVSSGVYDTTSYGIPLQNMYPSSNQGWVLDQGYDQNNRLINLPTSCGITGGYNKYFGGTFYSKDVSGTEYEAVCGGAWDTYYWANINTLRVWETVGSHSMLYGNRPIYRG